MSWSRLLMQSWESWEMTPWSSKTPATVGLVKLYSSFSLLMWPSISLCSLMRRSHTLLPVLLASPSMNGGRGTTSPPARYKDSQVKRLSHHQPSCRVQTQSGETTLSPPALLQGTDTVSWNDSLTTSPPARHGQTGETTLPHSTPARQTDEMTLLHLASQPDHGTDWVTNPPARPALLQDRIRWDICPTSWWPTWSWTWNREARRPPARHNLMKKTLPLLADQHEHEQRQGKTTPSARQQGKKQLVHTLLTSPVTKRGPQKTPPTPLKPTRRPTAAHHCLANKSSSLFHTHMHEYTHIFSNTCSQSHPQPTHPTANHHF